MGIYITLSMSYWRYHGALIERLGRGAILKWKEKCIGNVTA